MPRTGGDGRGPSPPPGYAESTTSGSETDEAMWSHNNGPWVVRRISIHVESTWADTESSTRSSLSPSGSTDQKSARLGLFKRDDPRERIRAMKQGLKEPFPNNQMGTQVTIEATQPLRNQAEKRIELKGLEQAASAKRWTGTGRPAEAWGKLTKDPELWDSSGDTYVYFGYQRSSPSFRIRSSTLEETKSDLLISKLQEGYRKDPRSTRSISQSTSSSSLSGIKSLNMNGKSRSQDTEADTGALISHEIYFPAPHEASRMDVLRYHLTTRNMFAVFMDRALVGLTFYQALVDLQERLEDYIPESNSAQTIMRYLVRNGLHNVSNEPAAAAGLLAWSEDNYWQEGWREGYIHCCGMYAKLRFMPEFRDISHVSRSLLERSSLEVQVRIQETEDRLATFKFEDMWPARRDGHNSVPASFNSFRTFLVRHYEKACKNWPPRTVRELDTWLPKELVSDLQRDFSALYNYYVDQDVIWDDADQHIIRRTDHAPVRMHDNKDFCLEKAIMAFDQKLKFSHLPHPYPLIPHSIPVDDAAVQSQSRTLFSSKTKSLEKRILAASHEASNAILLSSEITSNPLVEAFLKFDRSDRLGEEDPRTVRKARWLLIYGVLQMLSNIAVETPGVWFKDGARYYTNARLRGMPPWETAGTATYEDPGKEDVYRWLTPKTS